MNDTKTIQHILNIINQTLCGAGDSDQLSAAIFGIATTTRGKQFLELGTRSGCTTIPLLLSAKILGAKLTSIDIQYPLFSCPQDLMENWNFVKTDAIKFLETTKEHYDLIFVDDWHDGFHVKKELDLIAPLCSKSTIVLLHDLMYGWKNPEYNTCNNGAECGWGAPSEFDNGGPYWAVSNMDSDTWEFSTIPFCNGLTILRRKK